jgi:predicted Zn-dependent protease with MMP-like domain
MTTPGRDELRPRSYTRRRPLAKRDRPEDAASIVERYVQLALEDLPAQYADRLDNLVFVVRREPGLRERASLRLTRSQSLYGLYQGVPITLRGSGYGLPGYHLTPPDKITIFWFPLVRDFEDNGRLRRQVKKTVLHEIAHHFGINDDDLRHTSVR